MRLLSLADNYINQYIKPSPNRFIPTSTYYILPILTVNQLIDFLTQNGMPFQTMEFVDSSLHCSMILLFFVSTIESYVTGTSCREGQTLNRNYVAILEGMFV